MKPDLRSASLGGTLRVADKLVPRLGFGAMQLTRAADRGTAIDVVRRAVDLGVRFIDTSGYYGPDVANEVIAAALHPYPDDLLIASKVGARREGDRFVAADTPEQIRRAVEHDLTVLRLDALDLVHARRMPGSATPYPEMIAALGELRHRGLVRHIGVSNVDATLLQAAQEIAPISSVENELNVANREHDPLVEVAERQGLAFLPFHPLGLGKLTRPGGPLAEVAADLGCTAAQVALAWLLHRSAAIAPIPGTTSVSHLQDNLAAAGVELTDQHVQRLDGAAG